MFVLVPQVKLAIHAEWRGTARYFWVTDRVSQDKCIQYNSSGVYQSVSFSVAAQETQPQGITWDGTSFWVTGYDTDTVYKYNSAGVYQSVSFSVAAQEAVPYSLEWDGTGIVMVGPTYDKVWKYYPVNGVISATNLGGQNYVRVA